jgi:hypothetical protein
MAADPADYFQKVGRSTATTLSAPGFTAGGTSVTVGSTTNWDTTTGITFAIDEVDNNGNRVVGTYNVFRGKVATATSITNMTYVGGDAARNYSAGATTRVYQLVSAYRENRLVDGLLVQHNQDGTHDAITSTNATMTTPKVITSINDTNANELFRVTATASAVNEFTVANAATGNGPTLSATGGDTNVDMNFSPKGTGQIKGVVNHLYNPYKFSVYRSTNQTISANVDTLVQFDAKVFDTGTNIDVVTNKGRFTAPIAGFYYFSACLAMPAGSYMLPSIRKNGTAAYLGTEPTSGAGSVSSGVSALVQLAANDYIEIYVTSATTTISLGASISYFQGFLVSAT